MMSGIIYKCDDLVVAETQSDAAIFYRSQAEWFETCRSGTYSYFQLVYLQGMTDRGGGGAMQ